MTSFSERLKQERKRLGLSQEKFAVLGGVTRDAQMNYESGARKPDSGYLERIQEGGVNLLFLFGKDDALVLNNDEIELVSLFRRLDLSGKARVLGVMDGMNLPSAEVERAARAIFHGPVGQQVAGDINAPQTINVGRKKK